MNRRGFTLLEVLLAITILSTLMAFTAQTVIRSTRDKKKLQTEIDRDSRLMNALRTIERDVNLAFHYRGVLAEVEKDVKKKSGQQQSQPNSPPTPENPNPTGGPNDGRSQPPPQGFDFEPKKYEQLTQFMGTESYMHFTSISHVRTTRDAQESDQQEIGYYLDGCGKKNSESGGQCLWRRSSPYIDIDVTKGGGAVLLLSGVKTFKLRYFGEDKSDWISEWKTKESLDDLTVDKFPLAVEVNLAIVENEKESSISTVIPIFFPNNKSKSEAASTNSTSPQQPQSTTTPTGR